MKKLMSTMAIAASLMMAGCAQTAPMSDDKPAPPRSGGAHDGMMDRLFDGYDLNGDGGITETELYDALDARFDRMDRNNDGVLSKSEFESQSQARRGGGQRLQRMDEDGDGEISRAEFTNGSSMMIFRADADADGTTTRAEFEALMSQLRGRFGR